MSESSLFDTIILENPPKETDQPATDVSRRHLLSPYARISNAYRANDAEPSAAPSTSTPTVSSYSRIAALLGSEEGETGGVVVATEGGLEEEAPPEDSGWDDESFDRMLCHIDQMLVQVEAEEGGTPVVPAQQARPPPTVQARPSAAAQTAAPSWGTAPRPAGGASPFRTVTRPTRGASMSDAQPPPAAAVAAAAAAAPSSATRGSPAPPPRSSAPVTSAAPKGKSIMASVRAAAATAVVAARPVASLTSDDGVVKPKYVKPRLLQHRRRVKEWMGRSVAAVRTLTARGERVLEQAREMTVRLLSHGQRHLVRRVRPAWLLELQAVDVGVRAEALMLRALRAELAHTDELLAAARAAGADVAALPIIDGTTLRTPSQMIASSDLLRGASRARAALDKRARAALDRLVNEARRDEAAVLKAAERRSRYHTLLLRTAAPPDCPLGFFLPDSASLDAFGALIFDVRNEQGTQLARLLQILEEPGSDPPSPGDVVECVSQFAVSIAKEYALQPHPTEVAAVGYSEALEALHSRLDLFCWRALSPLLLPFTWTPAMRGTQATPFCAAYAADAERAFAKHARRMAGWTATDFGIEQRFATADVAAAASALEDVVLHAAPLDQIRCAHAALALLSAEAIRVGGEPPPGADDLFPLFLRALVAAAPTLAPCAHAHVSYMSAYTPPAAASGEFSYALLTLAAAVTHVTNGPEPHASPTQRDASFQKAYGLVPRDRVRQPSGRTNTGSLDFPEVPTGSRHDGGPRELEVATYAAGDEVLGSTSSTWYATLQLGSEGAGARAGYTRLPPTSSTAAAAAAAAAAAPSGSDMVIDEAISSGDILYAPSLSAAPGALRSSSARTPAPASVTRRPGGVSPITKRRAGSTSTSTSPPVADSSTRNVTIPASNQMPAPSVAAERLASSRGSGQRGASPPGSSPIAVGGRPPHVASASTSPGSRGLSPVRPSSPPRRVQLSQSAHVSRAAGSASSAGSTSPHGSPVPRRGVVRGSAGPAVSRHPSVRSVAGAQTPPQRPASGSPRSSEQELKEPPADLLQSRQLASRFRPTMTRAEAEAELAHAPNDSFFIRNSSRPEARWALSFVELDEVTRVRSLRHLLVSLSPTKQYVVQGDDVRYRSIFDLLYTYRFINDIPPVYAREAHA